MVNRIVPAAPLTAEKPRLLRESVTLRPTRKLSVDPPAAPELQVGQQAPVGYHLTPPRC